MNETERYEFIGRKKLVIKEQLNKGGIHHVTLSGLPADFYRMSKSQMERLSEYACDNMIAEMYDLPKYEITKRRRDFGLDQMTLTSIKADREDKSVAIYNEILRIVSNEYNNGNIPHTNSTPLNSEKEFLYMKATGIVRRIDDLGRVVIPKEIRRTMRIHEGDPLEIFTERDGEVIFKKYSPMAQLNSFASDYAEALNKAAGVIAVICDRDSVIAVSGIPKKEMAEQKITSELEGLTEKRKPFAFNGESAKLYVCPDNKYYIVCSCPIISLGDIAGCVCIVAKDTDHAPACTDLELKLASAAAHFLAKQLNT